MLTVRGAGEVSAGLSGAAAAVSAVRVRIRGLALLLGVSLASCAVVLEPTSRAYPVIAVLEVLVIVGFVTAGYLLLADPSQRSNGYLLVLSALLQVITHLHLVAHSPLPMLAWLCGPGSMVPAAIVLLRFPGNRLDRLCRWWLVVHLTWLVVTRLTITVPPPERRLGWWPTVPMAPNVAALGSTIGNVGLSLTTLVFAFLLGRRLIRSGGVARHDQLPVTIASISAAVTVVLHLLSVANSREGVGPLVLGIEQFGILSIPAAFILSTIFTRSARAGVADLLLKVNHSTTPVELQAELAQTLSDPKLGLLIKRSGGSSWVDVHGQERDPDAIGSGLRVPINGDNGPLAILITNLSIARHKHLLDAIVAASRLTLQNAAALAELRDSRARIVKVGLDERRRLERNLHDGVQQRMLAVKMRIEQVRTAIDEPTRAKELAEGAIEEVGEAMGELRDLARGLHPAVLTQSGLLAAVESTTDRLPILVRLTIPDRRWPESVEGAAYFFISEGLNNIVKHAGVREAAVRVVHESDSLTIEVIDHGRGGADRERGSGLMGLIDRIAAIGGTVKIISHENEGTCLLAHLPCV